MGKSFTHLRLNDREGTVARAAEAVARHTKATMPSTAACRLDEVKVEFRILGNDDRMRRNGIKILYPLARYAGWCSRFRRKRCNIPVRTIGRHIECRDIDTRNACQAQKECCPVLACTHAFMIGIHQSRHDSLPLADHKSICNLCEGLRIERCAGPPRNDERIMLCALSCTRLDAAECKHFDHVEIVHFKGNSKADDSEVCKRCLRLHTHHRRLCTLVARNFGAIRQEYALTRRIDAPIEELVDDMNAEVRHTDEVSIRISQSKSYACALRIAIVSAFPGKTLLQFAFQLIIQIPPLPFVVVTPSPGARAMSPAPQ